MRLQDGFVPTTSRGPCSVHILGPAVSVVDLVCQPAHHAQPQRLPGLSLQILATVGMHI